MTITELGTIFREMYTNATEKEQATFIHLFGIKYGQLILKNKYSASEILKASDINESYKTDVVKELTFLSMLFLKFKLNLLS